MLGVGIVRRPGVVLAAAIAVVLVGAVPAGGTVSGDDGVIAFVSDESGVDQIYSIEWDGSGLTQLTTFDPASDGTSRIDVVRWSPDGRTIAFGRSGLIWLIGAGGGDPVYVAEGTWPAWSPDGSMLAYAKQSVGVGNGMGTRVIALLDLATRVETVVTDPGDWVDWTGTRTVSDWSPIWAPDGDSVYFARHFPGSASWSSESLYRLDLASGDWEYVGALFNGAPGWAGGYDISPDGLSYLYTTATGAAPGAIVESSLTEPGVSSEVPMPPGFSASGPPSYAPTQFGLVVRLSDVVTGIVPTSSLWKLQAGAGWSELTAGRLPAWQPVNPYPMGLVDTSQGEWHLRDAAGNVDSFYYGDPGDVPFMGDWDCDGVDTPGLYRQSDGYVYLRNANTQGVAEIRF